MNTTTEAKFLNYYDLHCKHLKLQGLQPRTIDAYSRAIRRIGAYFDGTLDTLSEDQLLDYFHQLKEKSSWSTVKLDPYGLKFFYGHVLKRDWQNIPNLKSPKVSRIPDIVTIGQARQIFLATRKLSYRVFFYTIYSMGLRLGEGLRLQTGDIDAAGRLLLACALPLLWRHLLRAGRPRRADRLHHRQSMTGDRGIQQ